MTNVTVEEVQFKNVQADNSKPATAGGIEIAFRTEGRNDIPATVRLSWFVEGEVAHVEIAPEEIEKAAALMRDVRNELRDYRSVCAVHGYVESYDCPACKAASTPAEAH